VISLSSSGSASRRVAALGALSAALLLAGAASAKPKKPRGELVVVARVVAASSGAPHCGILYAATVVKYEVLKVIQGAYGEPLLYATHGCVEFALAAGIKFKAGEIHVLTLTRSYEYSVASFDTVGDPHMHRWWVRDVSPTAPPAKPAVFSPRE
jgi:hypothetical protein